jgi:hypothetical protein
VERAESLNILRTSRIRLEPKKLKECRRYPLRLEEENLNVRSSALSEIKKTKKYDHEISQHQRIISGDQISHQVYYVNKSGYGQPSTLAALERLFK